MRGRKTPKEVLLESLHDHAIAFFEIDRLLAVQGQEDVPWALRQFDFDLRSITQNERTLSQTMRTNRRESESVEAWLEDWPTAGERVGRRARWRRDDHPVGPDGVDPFPANRNLKSNDPRDCALGDDGVVDDQAAVSFFSTANELNLKQGPLGDRESVRAEEPLKNFDRFFFFDFGQKPETAEVDPKDRNGFFGHQASDAQECPVAPEYYDQIGVGEELSFGQETHLGR